jgi:uncharacterized membrane protein YeaQ/YmgE (transglycosylase-associated protein family)
MTLRLRLTPQLTEAITDALTSESLSDAERTSLQEALDPTSGGASLDALDAVDLVLRQTSKNVSVDTLLRGSSVEFPAFDQSAPSIDPKQELRKSRLKQRVEERAFARLVSNVDNRQAHERQFRAGAAVSLKAGSFGIHIIIGMMCGFLAGYLLSRVAYGGGQTVQIIGGIIGMVGTLIMEVVLYIIRDEKARLKAEATVKKMR